MNREQYSNIIKDHKGITYEDIIKGHMCPACHRCRDNKMLPICVQSLQLGVKLWNKGKW